MSFVRAKSSRVFLFVRIFIFLGLATLMACADFLGPKPEATSASGPDFTEQKMLKSIEQNILTPAYQRFSQSAEKLENQLQSWCEELQKPDEDIKVAQERRAQAQEAWRDAMLDFQFIDALPFGPIVTFMEEKESSYRFAIYSDAENPVCSLDVEVVRRAQNTAPRATLPPEYKGLQSIEYLLFSEPEKTPCPNRRQFRAVHNWLKEKTVKQQHLDRCEYTRLAAADIGRKARQLAETWKTQYGPQMSLKAVNALFGEASKDLIQAITTVERSKDDRLAKPMGLKDCNSEETQCANYLEHKYAKLGLPALVVRLRALEQTTLGDTFTIPNSNILVISSQQIQEGLGIDDFLMAKGFKTEADHLRKSVREIREMAEKLAQGPDMASQLAEIYKNKKCSPTDNDESLCGLYGRLVQFTAWLKTDFLVALSAIGAPQNASGDAD